MDTIFALASASGKAGVSVVRISGEDAFQVVSKITGSSAKVRYVGLRKIQDLSGVTIDYGLVVSFKGPQSFTGEDVVELHLHGSNAVVASVLRLLGSFRSLRSAEPGEFTRRALENNKLDLAQVEGLADLIEAETEAQRAQAFRVLSGDIGKKADIWRTDLIRSSALLEATIDFADEDVPEDVTPEVIDIINKTLNSLTLAASGVNIAERVRSGFEVAIVGAPNVGKSSLLNRLAGREAAITSEIAGTTRDVIEVKMDLDGLPVTFLDTAGLRLTSDAVETIGIAKALERAALADLTLLISEDGQVPEQARLKKDDLLVLSKADVTRRDGAVSSITGQGIDQLISNITRILNKRSATVGVATRERHRVALTKSIKNLEDAQGKIKSGCTEIEFIAEDIRLSVLSLDALIGRVDVESVLDEIFSNFCLGK
ncbi:tRNA uridine-5-carboxymethylaminomethyl(34) synthesis GTPase MnmE [Paracoccaceae bacterium]|nr:tRNA uridine-5-carboxymethylaminomethyl(34) synthesis GTPase MnmE [Paracoccaceae bacterium]